MRIKQIYLIGIVSTILLQGCIDNKYINNFTGNSKDLNGNPKWLSNPYIANDQIAAVGCAGEHFRGKEAQKQLAISRAIDQIAVQKRVTVNNVTLRKKTISNGIRTNASATSSSMHSVDNLSIGTKVKDIYTKNNGEMCVWVILK